MSNINSKIIYSYVYNPRSPSLFKKNKNTDCAQHTMIRCERSESCDLFKKGQCALLNTCLFKDALCPYGVKTREAGYTPRASKFYDWMNQKEKVKTDVECSLGSAKDVLAIVGDYVYLPYAHMDLSKDIPFLNGRFIKKDEFTVETIVKLVDFVPRTLLFDELIEGYQKEEIPKFIKHLAEKMPALYNDLVALRPTLHVYGLSSNIGREAILATLKPNTGMFCDVHGGEWSWDGEYLVSTNSHASFLLVKNFSEIRIKPGIGVAVKVTADEQVTTETVFKD